jgi:hypothetical protein
MPPPQQPWMHEIHVGIVEAPIPGFHGGFNEERYLKETDKVKVRYSWGIDYDHISALTPVPPEDAQLSPREKVARFMSPDALALYDGRTHTREAMTYGALQHALLSGQTILIDVAYGGASETVTITDVASYALDMAQRSMVSVTWTHPEFDRPQLDFVELGRLYLQPEEKEKEN